MLTLKAAQQAQSGHSHGMVRLKQHRQPPLDLNKNETHRGGAENLESNRYSQMLLQEDDEIAQLQAASTNRGG